MAVYDLARGLGRDPIDALVLGFANPLVLLHLVSGAHNEAIMLAFLVTGVTLGSPRRVVAPSRDRPVRHGRRHQTAGHPGRGLPRLAVGDRGRPPPLSTGPPDWLIAAGEALGVIALAGQLTGWGWGWVDAITNTEPVDAYLSLTRIAGGAVALVTGIQADAGAVGGSHRSGCCWPSASP